MDRAEELYGLLRKKDPFCFIKMNDGEISAIYDTTAVISRGSDHSSPEMSSKLRACLDVDLDNYYVGVPCGVCRSGDYRRCMDLVGESTRVMNTNVLINSNVWRTLDVFRETMIDRRVIIITNERNIKNIGALEKFGIIPYMKVIVSESNAFDTDYERVSGIDFEDGAVIMCMCGPLGRILCSEWFRRNRTLTCLELGILFDPFLRGKTYAYHTGNHPRCNGCFPELSLTTSQNDEIMELIENPQVENECFYSYDETYNYYVNFFNNQGALLKNTLIRLKKNPDDILMRYIWTRFEGEKLKEYVDREYKTRIVDGYTLEVEKQALRLIEFCIRRRPKRILEIGFNYGHSSLLFLLNTAGLNTEVVSLDIGDHSRIGSDYIRREFGRRHKFIFGNSLVEIPKLGGEFDLIFIDGGHSFRDSMMDIINCIRLSNSETLLVVDDIIKEGEDCLFWNEGPSNVWRMMTNEANMVVEEGCDKYDKGRGMAWGRYKSFL
jgi:predicted O-methyltransferase YrrM